MKGKDKAAEIIQGQDRPTCSHCLEVIQGAYRMFRELAFHADAEHPACNAARAKYAAEAATVQADTQAWPEPGQLALPGVPLDEAIPLYLAGASAEADRVQRAMDLVRSHPGLRLTQDWLEAIRKDGGGNESLHPQLRRLRASEDLDGVRQARIMWLLAPDNQSTGAWVELGYALALGVMVVVSGPAAKRCVFASLTHVEFSTDAEAWAYIVTRLVP